MNIIQKYLLIFIACMSTTISLADDIYLGYCNGNVVDRSIKSGVDERVSAAICLDKETFPMYKGAHITGVRIGLGSDASNVTIYIKDALEGKVLYSQNVGTCYKNWNDINFNKPFIIPDSDIYITYTCNGLSPVGFSGTAYEKGCWVNIGAKWTDRKVEASGSVCIQAIIDGETYKNKDAALIAVDEAKAGKGKTFDVSGTFRNNTNETATGLTLSYITSESQTPIVKEATTEEVLPGEIGKFVFTSDPLNATGEKIMTVTLSAVNGHADTWNFNNTATSKVNVYGELVRKNVLLEYFTGVRCSNCPIAQKKMKSVLQGKDNVVWVSHHWGFGTDAYTIDGSKMLGWFYDGNLFAPAGMFDRRNMASYGAQANGGATESPIFLIISENYIETLLSACTGDIAPVKVEIDNSFDQQSRQLSISVSSTAIEGLEMKGGPRLYVYLTEDGIQGVQAGASGLYTHDHVMRKFVSEVWGDALYNDAKGGTTNKYTVNIPNEWNPKKMNVIAFVANYNSSNKNDCIVYNAAETAVKTTSGIIDATFKDQTYGNGKAYNLNGQRINIPSKGLFIINGKLHVK